MTWLDVTNSHKRSSLRLHGINYSPKRFYSAVFSLLVQWVGKAFHLPMDKAPLGTRHNLKNETIFKKLASYKRSSLFFPSVSDKGKSLLTVDTSGLYNKIFLVLFSIF
jgi:hypothetical protein